MLSAKNKAKININGLYSHKPDCKMRDCLFWNNLYHCMNWTFFVKESKNGDLFMQDTYWGATGSDHRYKVTDENIDEWEFIFDRTKVRKVSSYEAEVYDKEDKFHVAIDSGGMYCGGKWFVKEDAKPSKQKQIERLQDEINVLITELKYKQNQLEKIV